MLINEPDLKHTVVSMIQVHRECADWARATSMTVEAAKLIPVNIEYKYNQGVAPFLAWAAAETDAVPNAFVVAQARDNPPANTMALLRLAGTEIDALKSYVNANLLGMVEGDGRSKAMLPERNLTEVKRLAAAVLKHVAPFLPTGP